MAEVRKCNNQKSIRRMFFQHKCWFVWETYDEQYSETDVVCKETEASDKLSDKSSTDKNLLKNQVIRIVCFACTILSVFFCLTYSTTYVHKPSKGHLDSTKQRLEYLKGTINWGLRYIHKPQLTQHLTTLIQKTACTAWSHGIWTTPPGKARMIVWIGHIHRQQPGTTGRLQTQAGKNVY
jgi:hypothetical protein